MDDPTDYYLGLGLSVVIMAYCIVMAWWGILCQRSDESDETYTDL